MARLFGREVEIYIGKRLYKCPPYDAEFELPFDDDNTDNVSKISLYNLSDSKIADMGSRPNIVVNAGYDGDLGSVFLGFADRVSTEWKTKVDKITNIEASDGANSYFKNKISRAYKPGFRASQILTDIERFTGVKFGAKVLKRDYVYTRGKTIKGALTTVLKSIASDCGCKVFTRNGLIYFRPAGEGAKIGFVLDSNSGLIGTPEHIQKEVGTGDKKKTYYGFKVRSLLNHRITTDVVIRIVSSTANGYFRVVKGSHIFNDRDFITEMEVYPQ